MEKTYKTMNELRDSQLLYDKNPPAFGVALIAIVAAALIGAVVWSLYATKAYVVKGNGSVVSDYKNYIMSAYTGEITEALVREGDYVEQGDVLFQLSSTDLDLQEEQLNGMIAVNQKKIAQYERLETSIKLGKNLFDENQEDDKSYYYQYESYLSQVAQKDIDVSAYKDYDYSDAQIESAVKANEAAIAEIYYSALKTVSDAVASLQSEISSYEVQLASVQSGRSDYPITASTSGIVHMDTEYKKGMVVQAAAAIGSIINENDRYTAEVYVSSNDMPLIHLGDTVDVAISGLAQTIYGTISGTVTYIASEATVNGETGATSFLVRIALDTPYLVSNKGNKVNVSNGMAVEARIQYDELTYFDYVLESLGVLTR